MKRIIYVSMTLMCVMLLTACGNKGGDNVEDLSGLPSDFKTAPDTLKVKALMDLKISPDSIAVFLCEAGAGMRPGVKVKDFADITTYMYTHCSEEDFEIFSTTFDSHVETLTPAQRMNLYAIVAQEDGNADKMGYELGLVYINSVMERDLTLGAVDKEIAEFRRACGKDEDTYNRFLKGFAVAISTRQPGELPAELVRKYGK